MQKEVFDFVVIGSGIAGLNSALSLAKYGKVLIVTKSDIHASSTFFAQGGIAAVTKKDDTIASHITDTLEAGYHHNKKDAVTFLAKSGRKAIKKLIDYGVAFDKQQDGDYVSSYEAAHSYPRILHATDFTGQEIEKILVAHVLENENITVWEQTPAIDLLVTDNRCLGVCVLHNNNVINVVSRCVVLATGGAGQLYQWTTNPEVSTGDGVALAHRAGAKLVDLEFIQFHPTALKGKETQLFLLSEALRGEGAYLVNDGGERFINELAPRDVVARAIFEQQKIGEVYLDLRHKTKQFLLKRFPKISAELKKRGYDIANNLIPVTPAEHFLCGGIVTDLYGRTSIANLFAYGEVAATGVHGANRLASNSLLEGIVFSSQIEKCIDELPTSVVIARSVSDEAIFKSLRLPRSLSVTLNDKVKIKNIKKQIRQIMWKYVGIVRSAKSLEIAKVALEKLQQEIDTMDSLNPYLLEVQNMLTVAKAINHAAQKRKYSLGTHSFINV